MVSAPPKVASGRKIEFPTVGNGEAATLTCELSAHPVPRFRYTPLPPSAVTCHLPHRRLRTPTPGPHTCRVVFLYALAN
ncbi:hypothetical protein E2C01_099557 [Portunus trituberculatus]|uniref:Uncharacterized protein n=1 Tax=Portunus trituberculatus TaxID=210409 RepID=A0A5B7KFN6_PORTR|nr:hypothetical protein [Portunus trituberculatus]